MGFKMQLGQILHLHLLDGLTGGHQSTMEGGQNLPIIIQSEANMEIP